MTVDMAKYPPRKRGRPLHGDEPKLAVTVRLPAELRDALIDIAIDNRRSVPIEVQIALEEYLTRNGRWPPKRKK